MIDLETAPPACFEKCAVVVVVVVSTFISLGVGMMIVVVICVVMYEGLPPGVPGACVDVSDGLAV